MKAETPKPPEKSWKDIIRQIIENASDKKLLGAWTSYTLTKTDEGFEEDLAFIACTAYLEAWKTKNYGKVSQRSHLAPPGSDEDTAWMFAGNKGGKDRFRIFDIIENEQPVMMMQQPVLNCCHLFVSFLLLC
ncbi:hypothetical protein KSF_085320 [Reticulibacter mediterranei]|uniref:Uncharacterized protein n=1 Tax=Reticulibacter mediterranei TaxID=2778369 RepID=A0A8J3N4W9_9CHLR|nr:hypothetical protein [Reticulibacter mediterranei]GHO98484.1 hypothetical protein KSF_085320 [Reticulibacter mediterranei]